jgi:hypothetical protein
MHDALPNLAWHHFAVPKAGNRRAEFEDACAGDAQACRFAVADGASESAYAATWAKLLVESYVRKRGRWSTHLALTRRRWQERCPLTDLPWYLEEKIDEGAFAAFLGVSFHGWDDWRAYAVGDTCLFHVRGDELQRSFPVRHSKEFGNRPNLLGSRSPANGNETDCARMRARWFDKDVLLLATDALAEWFLRQAEAGGKPWQELLGVGSPRHFADWVLRMRAAERLRNDDVTLLVIHAPQP